MSIDSCEAYVLAAAALKRPYQRDGHDCRDLLREAEYVSLLTVIRIFAEETPSVLSSGLAFDTMEAISVDSPDRTVVSMGLFSFSGHKKRSVFHGGGYYTGGFLHSNSSRRYYDPRYAHARPSMGQTLINAAGAALGGAVGAGVASNMAGKGSQGAAAGAQGGSGAPGVYVPGGSAGPTSTGVACPRCASVVPAGSKFCLECGNEIGGGFCGQCGAAVMPGARFCGQCGAAR